MTRAPQDAPPTEPLRACTVRFETRRCAFVIPALDASKTLGAVLDDLAPFCGRSNLSRGVFVIDDGSTDDTTQVALAQGARVVRHGSNRGKGAALRTGLAMAQREGFEAAVTLDADGQHAASDAAKLAAWGDDASLATTLVLGYRDLPGAGAPPANRFSNWVSNFFLSRFTGMPLRDTQCGLRRYPLAPILALGAREDGYGWEARVLIQAVRASVPISQVAVGVRYGEDHVTHFDNVRDPIKIIRAVLSSL